MNLNIAYPTYDEKDTKMIDYFDEEFLHFSEEYKVNKWSFASIIDNDIIKKCGYFESMPSNLSFISGAGEENVSRMVNKEKIESLPVSGYGLTPAACLHIYPMLKNDMKLNEIITTRQRVYRYEQGVFCEGTRLWEFWVREFVAVGTEDFVKSFLSDFETKSLSFAKKRYVEASIRSATDFFYPSRENKIIQRMQRKNNLKNELVVNINEKTVACASYNYHKTHFSRIFDFDDNGKIVTGCVGFGLNRWLAREKMHFSD